VKDSEPMFGNVVEITITGLGGAINCELEIIRRALEAEGIQVNVENRDPYEGDDIEDWLSRCRESRKNRKSNLNRDRVRIRMYHSPWGG
jgi:hypothetical protein